MSGIIYANKNRKRLVFTADNFYKNPDAIRDFALGQIFYTSTEYTGSRSSNFVFDGVKESIEDIIREEIIDWENIQNGVFEVYAGGDLSEINYDPHYGWNAFVFLSPDPPPESGITLQRHKETRSFKGDKGIKYNRLDKFQFDRADILGNIYNRIVILDGKLFRNYSEFFGWDLTSGMMVQTFKFNTRR
jgi:hypothetical protein